MARTLCAVCLLTATGFLTVGPACSQPPTNETLIFVIRAKPDLELKEIKELVTNTLEAIGGKAPVLANGKQPDIRALSAVEYGVYAKIENPDASPPPLPAIKTEKFELTQLPSVDPLWQLKLLGAQPRMVTDVAVEYTDATKGTFKLSKDSDALRAVQPGLYNLRLPADKAPAKFTANTTDTKSGSRDTLSGDWPQGDNFYLIRLDGFPSDKRTEFVTTIKDAKKVGNALDSFEIKQGVTLAIGTADAADDGLAPTKLKDRNQLYINVPKLQRGSAARAWMLFPLKKADVEIQLAKYNQLAGAELIRAIEDSKPARAGQPVVLTADGPPGWIELPLVQPGAADGLVPDAFGRMVYLVDQDPARVDRAGYQKVLDALPTAHRLVVYEFDNGVSKTALLYKRKPTQKKRQAVNEVELPEWEPLLRLAIAGPEPAKP